MDGPAVRLQSIHHSALIGVLHRAAWPHTTHVATLLSNCRVRVYLYIYIFDTRRLLCADRQKKQSTRLPKSLNYSCLLARLGLLIYAGGMHGALYRSSADILGG